ncbi:MAG TPA: TonB-dependent receptor, partial [Gemmatimonadaceae bacterium]|nr:TonB-dependent receptor [Gemmatimonadaceae bacterium]
KNSIFDLDANWSQTRFAVPYDSTGGAFLDDHQHDANGFLNLAWHRQAGDSAAEGAAFSDLFAGLFLRFGSLNYTPGAGDEPSFIFYPDTTPFNLRERRNFSTYGIKLDYAFRPHHELEFKFGTASSVTTGHEDFSTVDSAGNPGPGSNSGLSGSDVGLYAETAWSPEETYQIRAGVRYDAHTAPFAGTQSQVSPRLRLNWYPSTSTTAFIYFGRMFIPTNIEDLRSITSIAQADTVTSPTLPERDSWYEAGLVQRFPNASMITELDGFYKTSSPGIDDNTVPGSSIVTDVNIQHVWIKGIKGVLQYQPSGPLSGGINAAITHAYGEGTITGGFFPTTPPAGYFDLDHDQRLSVSANANYAPTAKFYMNGTVIFGSGLTNALDSTDCNCRYGTGLFDFDPGVKVPPSTIVNVAAGYDIVVGATVVKPQINVDNLFDRMYLLKGAFFSGASVGRPRLITLRVDVSY